MSAANPDFAPTIRPDCTDELTATMQGRIMVIDGAMGTAIQRDRPDEAGYRGERFKDWPSDLVGNNDLLNLTQPQIIEVGLRHVGGSGVAVDVHSGHSARAGEAVVDLGIPQWPCRRAGL